MMKDPTQAMELTQDEAELYDRQIRLWGVESQKRLRCARVLIVGVQGYGCEVAKNIILSGVKAVTLLDDGVVSADDACAQFLAPRDQLGQNRAEASLSRAQQLNPMVEVLADTENVSKKPDSYFGDFDVICASKCSTEQLIRIDRLCRKTKTLFFCGDVFGMFGYTFADLGDHSFEQVKTVYVVAKKHTGSGDATHNGEGTITSTSVETTSFTPLQEALNVDWRSEKSVKRLKKMDPSYFLLKVLLRFRSENGRDPSPSKRAEDLEVLSCLREKELTELGVPVDTIPDDLMTNVFAEVSPVCAIVGGVMVQEIIKAVSRKESPHNNFFFFNPTKCLGFVECVNRHEA